MTPIILSDEQARLLQGASPPVVLFDSRGKKLAEVRSVEPVGADGDSVNVDEWASEALHRRERALREGLRESTTQEVLARLRALKPE